MTKKYLQKNNKPLLKSILALQNNQIDEKYNKIVLNPKKQEEFILYMCKCNDNLLNDEKSLKFLFKKRRITKETVLYTGLGIDKEKRHWVIPTFEYTTDVQLKILGFEYRPADLSKNGLNREKDCPTGLAQINCYIPGMEKLVIVEGYFDGYALFQYLKEQKQDEFYHIVTPSNGVNGLFKQISQIDFRKYKEFELFIDNDNVSKPIAKKIIEFYPQFHNIELKCGCKDFNEHYIKCLLNK